MKHLSLAFFAILAPLGAVWAQTLEGHWAGTLKAGPQELRLALHVTKAANGEYKATLDSIDQGANGIPVSSVSLKGSAVKLELPAIGGSYEGKLNGASSAMSGTWTQAGNSLPLDFSRASEQKSVERKPKPTDIDGDWAGALDAGGQTLRLVLHIRGYADGLGATMDSVDQGALGIPVTTMTRNGKDLQFEVKAVAGRYEGKFDGGLTAVTGTWSQPAGSLPLVLKRAAAK